MKLILRYGAVLVLCFCLILAGCRPSIRQKEKALRLTGELAPAAVSDQNRVFYEIFVGSFSDGNGDGKGDLRGLIDRLDYLNDGDPASGKSLGVEGLWLMPINPSPSYHKYDVTGYTKVDSSYGTVDDMKELAAACHERGMTLIIDLVLNHTSKYHPWFTAAQKARSEGDALSRYYDFYSVSTEHTGGGWYYFATDPEGRDWYYEGNFDSGMPELNYDCEAVWEEIGKIFSFWLSDVGIDGFRLDAVKYFCYGDDGKNVEVLRRLRAMAESVKSDVYLVGENWSAQESIALYDQAIGCFDFPFSQAEGYVGSAVLMKDAEYFVTSAAYYYNLIHSKNPDAILRPFLSNHDMDRCAGYFSVSNGQMQMAANLYLLYSGSPFLYYGEEIGMKGSRGSSMSDANRRLAMLWGDGDTVRDPGSASYSGQNQINGTVLSQVGKDDSLFTHYKKLLALRAANPEIARGEVSAVYFGNSAVAGLRFTYEGSTVYVIHNLGSTEVTVDVSGLGKVLRGFAGEGEASLRKGGLTLSGRTSAIIR